MQAGLRENGQKGLFFVRRLSMSEVADRVKKVVAQILKIEPSRISEESRFVEDLGAESIQSVELVAAFEEEFDIDMDEDEALSVKSVGKAIDYIDNIVSRK